MNGVILIQPPFVQLNGPYPAPYYLKSFIEKRGKPVTVLDHSIGLFERIFSRSGLERIFQDALLITAGKNSSRETERFLSERDLWLNSIERLIAFLRGRDPEWGHFLALANGCLPGGPRTDAYLANAWRAESGAEISVDEAKTFATLLLSDLADFITHTLDSGFGLVRYTPVMEASLNGGFRDFASVQKKLNGYIMEIFYRPFLAEEWEKLEKSGRYADGPFLLGLTIPFPGCLAGALVCADSAKKRFGSVIRTVAGGGFVNTELRYLNAPEFHNYFDFLSLDIGYSFLASILDFEVTATEEAVVKVNFPDYSEVDFSRYLYPVDDANPMHRLWSDGHWLKAFLAHGCYWHSCSFCDVTLDYIKNFIPVDVPSLFGHLKNQAEKTGVRGVHLCDEAAPVSSLLEFALLNREAGLPLNFWGNIRFEKDYNPDIAAILAAGGLMGVSAGLEVATERGFKATAKGINLNGAVKTLAAFKESGILIHAYLIYGFWDEDEQELIDSAETTRQLFAHGLLDSAFWHKFILTCHSRIYAEKKRGLHPGLKVNEECGGEIFALNDLSFEGEEGYGKYTLPLDRLLKAWMAGETEAPVSAAFPFRVKAPSVPPGLVAAILDEYARERDANRTIYPARQNYRIETNVLFLGTIPLLRQRGKNVSLFWRWHLTDWELKTGGTVEAEEIAILVKAASKGKGLGAVEFYSALEKISGEAGAGKIWKLLRKSGLAVYCPNQGISASDTITPSRE